MYKRVCVTMMSACKLPAVSSARMASTSYSIATRIHSDPDALYAFLTDPTNFQRVNPTIIRVRRVPVAMETDTQFDAHFTDRLRMCGIPYTVPIHAHFTLQHDTRTVGIAATASGVTVVHNYRVTVNDEGHTWLLHDVSVTVAPYLCCCTRYVVNTARTSHYASDERLAALFASK